VVIAAMAAYLLQDPDTAEQPVPYALLIAIYTVAAHDSRRTRAWALALLAAGASTQLGGLILNTPSADTTVRALVMYVAAWAMGRATANRHAYARELEREREREAVRAVERERAAIARELHDMVAHHLASTVLRVGVARHVLPQTDPRLAEVLDDVHSSANTALTDLRRLLASLREPSADQLAPLLAETTDLPATVQEVLDRSRRSGLTIEAEVDPRIAELDAMRSLTVLRLVQEGLANVTKHAGPQAKARTRIRMEDGTLFLELENTLLRSAAPARPAEAGPGTGYGLLGMRERVTLVGGTIDAGPAGDGWRIVATLPASASGVQG